MAEVLQDILAKSGCKAKTVSIGHIAELKKEITDFAENEVLNGFQKYIIDTMYSFEAPSNFEAKTVIVIAVPVPAYAKAEFTRNGKRYPLISLASYYPGGEDPSAAAEKILKAYIGPLGYQIAAAPQLPLKRLAARSGLAVYGRNNICYVEGMGSFLTFVAYFTDMPFNEDDWTEMKTAEACQGCKACLNSCPTGAIRNERFLLDNERCISCMNEGPGEFPDWLPLSAHNCIYDCLKCQKPCPMNIPYINNVIGPIVFSEEETNLLLSEVKPDVISPETERKLNILGMYYYLNVLPRNLKVLFELYDNI